MDLPEVVVKSASAGELSPDDEAFRKRYSKGKRLFSPEDQEFYDRAMEKMGEKDIVGIPTHNPNSDVAVRLQKPDWSALHHAYDAITQGSLSASPERARAKAQWEKDNPADAFAAEYAPQAVISAGLATAAGPAIGLALGDTLGPLALGTAGRGVPGLAGLVERAGSKAISGTWQGALDSYLFPDRSLSTGENLERGGEYGMGTNLLTHALGGPLRSQIKPNVAKLALIARQNGMDIPLSALPGAPWASRLMAGQLPHLRTGPAIVGGILGGEVAEHGLPYASDLLREHPTAAMGLAGLGATYATGGLLQNMEPYTNMLLRRAARGYPFAANPLIPGTRQMYRGDRPLSPETAETEAHIRNEFGAQGVDPDIAVRVARSEGLGSEYVGDDGSSFGPFQLHYGGMAKGKNAVSGLGDEFTKDTGLHAQDPATVPEQVKWVAKYVRMHDWSPWHGWKGDVREGLPTSNMLQGGQ